MQKKGSQEKCVKVSFFFKQADAFCTHSRLTFGRRVSPNQRGREFCEIFKIKNTNVFRNTDESLQKAQKFYESGKRKKIN